jgi:hypothetical protein
VSVCEIGEIHGSSTKGDFMRKFDSGLLPSSPPPSSGPRAVMARSLAGRPCR